MPPASERAAAALFGVLPPGPPRVRELPQGLTGGAPPLPKGESPPGMAESELAELRVKALLALGHPAPSVHAGLVPEFFGAYALVAGDPDIDLAPWIRTGAPLGVLRPVTPCGVFPTVAESAPATEMEIEGIAANPEGWGNYRSADSRSASTSSRRWSAMAGRSGARTSPASGRSSALR
eukprot:3840191-Alexandrium_andersonii.AAC.1